MKRKQNITIAYRQGCILSHRFKESKKFATTVKEPGISKNTIVFKINLYIQTAEKSPELKKSTKLVFYFKNYFYQIKLVCRASGKEFKHLLFE